MLLKRKLVSVRRRAFQEVTIKFPALADQEDLAINIGAVSGFRIGLLTKTIFVFYYVIILQKKKKRQR